MQITLPSPAKLNLFLHITGQLPNGYHTLQTVFQFIDLNDQLTFCTTNETSNSGEIIIEGAPQEISLEENLIYKAAIALKDATQLSSNPIKLGAKISIEKSIPMGGGLGGGSSNAATTLLALNQLWNTNLSLDELAIIGLKLGADVPVFIQGTAAWAEGVGEELTPLQLEEPWFLVVHPGCHVPTARIFSHEELTRNAPPIRIAHFLEQGGRNDCEPIVKKLYPEVDKALNWLHNYAPAKLTGTGACIFAAFSNEANAKQAKDSLPEKFQAFVAKGLNRSPTHQALQTLP